MSFAVAPGTAPSAAAPLTPIARLAGARPDDVVRVVSSPVAAVELLAAGLPPGAEVLALGVDGPGEDAWGALERTRQVRRVAATATLAGTVARVAEALAERPVALVAVPGVASATGELLPVAELADLAHARGAALAVDGTHLAAAGRLDVAAAQVDHALLAACELGARFSAAALVGRALDGPATPGYPAGAAPRTVALALAAASAELAGLPDGALAGHVADLRATLANGLAALPGVRVARRWPDATAHAGVLAFDVPGWQPSQLLARLDADGPVRLDVAGAGVRVRLGARTDREDVHALLEAMEDVVTTAPAR